MNLCQEIKVVMDVTEFLLLLQTFGNIQQRPNLGYGGYAAGHGDNYRSSYNWGRGHGYGGRRHGDKMPF